MFTKARLRIALLYASLMGITLALVAGGIVLLGARQTQRTDDLALRLRAEDLASGILRRGLVPPLGPFGPSDGRREPPPKNQLEREGMLVYILAVEDGKLRSLTAGTISGLPGTVAAQEALDAGEPRFQNLSIEDGEVRVYSLPVQRDGQTVAVVQVARSRYFVDEVVTRLLMIVLGLGLTGLAVSGLAGFWLAGRTMRPIAAALQRQRDFTADASHELRTPLALVRGNAELLTRHPDRPIGEYMDVVQDIVDESDRLGRLVKDLLTLARADDGRLHLAATEVDLSTLGNALVHDFQAPAAAKGLAVRGDISHGVAVTGDRDRLHELGVILMDNAVRYTQHGQIALRIVRDGQGALIAVTDTGPGIAAEHLPRLFERFYRTDDSRSTEQGGAGLGLSIAQWIAEAHGGRIEVTSKVGQGSTFTVHLPRLLTANHSPPPPNGEDEPAADQHPQVEEPVPVPPRG